MDIYILVLYLCLILVVGTVLFMSFCLAVSTFFSVFLYIFLHCWSSKTNCSKCSAWDSCYIHILKDAIKWNWNNWIIKAKSFVFYSWNVRLICSLLSYFHCFSQHSLSNPASLSNGNLTHVYVCCNSSIWIKLTIYYYTLYCNPPVVRCLYTTIGM